MEAAIILWIVCAAVGAFIGHKKNEVLGGFILGALLGPVGVLILTVLPAKKKAVTPD